MGSLLSLVQWDTTGLGVPSLLIVAGAVYAYGQGDLDFGLQVAMAALGVGHAALLIHVRMSLTTIVVPSDTRGSS
jgi:hypothetical protein